MPMRIFVWIILLLGVGYIGYILTQSQELTTSGKSNQNEFEQPALIEGMKLYEYHDNKLSWSFLIKNAEIYERKKQTFIEEITGQIFTENAVSDPIRVRAMKGTLNNRSNQLTLEKNVYISFTDGSNIDTEHLVIDLRNERIFNQHQVVLKSRTGKVVGSEMEYDIKASNLRLKQITMNFPFD